MAQSTDNIITLYDIEAKEGVGAWSPNTWKARLALNLKGIPYKTVWVSYPDIEARMKELGAEPGYKNGPRGDFYTLPVIHDPAHNAIVTDSWKIAEYLDKHYPGPTILPEGTKMLQRVFLAWHEDTILDPVGDIVCMDCPKNLDDRGAEYFIRTRGEWWKKPLDQWVTDRPAQWKKIRGAYGKLARMFEEYHDLTASGTGETDPWVMGGEHPTFADFVVVSALLWTKKLIDREGEGWEILGTSQDGKWERYLKKCEPYLQEN